MDNLGVAMNATTLQAYALKKGVNFDWNTASNAEKSQLAMQMFFEKTEQYAGNFARESSETISGSLGSVKAAFSNVLGNLTLGNDIQPSLTILNQSVSTFLQNNFIPAIKNIFTGLLDGIGAQISEKIPGLSFIFSNLETVIIGVTAAMVAYKAAMAIAGIIDTLRKATEGQTLAQTLLNAVMNANPFVLIATLITGLVAAFITLWNTNDGFREALTNAWNAIKSAFEHVWNSIATFFTQTLPNAFTNAFNAVKDFGSNVISKITSIFSKISDIGKNLVKGLWNGISDTVGWVLDKIRGFGQSILNGIKNIFGIHSPSTEMAWMGEMLDRGLAEGIEDNTKPIKNAISDVTKMTTGTLDSNLSVNSAVSGTYSYSPAGEAGIIREIQSLRNAILNMQIVIDSGKFVGETKEKYDNAFGMNNLVAARGLAR